MKIVLPMITMLTTGLALGAGGSTLLWSGMLSKAHANTKGAIATMKDWEDIASSFEKSSRSFENTAKECLTLLSQRPR